MPGVIIYNCNDCLASGTVHYNKTKPMFCPHCGAKHTDPNARVLSKYQREVLTNAVVTSSVFEAVEARIAFALERMPDLSLAEDEYICWDVVINEEIGDDRG